MISWVGSFVAYAALDAMAERMAATGVAPDSVELVVVDDERRPMTRPDAALMAGRIANTR